MKKMPFVMQVHEIFQMSDKTVFVGSIDAEEDYLGESFCSLSIDGQHLVRVKIEGETLFGRTERALWSRERLALEGDAWRGKNVLLKSDDC